VSYDFIDEEIWKRIPAWSEVSRTDFSSHTWQLRNSVTSLKGLASVLGSSLNERLFQDLEEGLAKAPMNVRLTPYLVWRDISHWTVIEKINANRDCTLGLLMVSPAQRVGAYV